MNIRAAAVSDALTIWRLHGRSVRALCRAHYAPAQLDAWLQDSTLAKFEARLARHRAFVAEQDGIVTGYVRWRPATNELCSLFVDPDHVRQGVGTALMAHAVADARAHGARDLWLDASLNAISFYERDGWRRGERRLHGTLPCLRMTRRLGAVTPDPAARSSPE